MNNQTEHLRKSLKRYQIMKNGYSIRVRRLEKIHSSYREYNNEWYTNCFTGVYAGRACAVNFWV